MKCSCEETLQVVRGTTNPFRVQVYKNGQNEAYTLDDGQALVFGVKRRPDDGSCVILKTMLSCGDGKYTFLLEPSDTTKLAPGYYWYDIGLQDGDNVFYNVVEARPFRVKSNITQLGDADQSIS